MLVVVVVDSKELSELAEIIPMNICRETANM
jgi:hypothetical protein